MYMKKSGFINSVIHHIMISGFISVIIILVHLKIFVKKLYVNFIAYSSNLFPFLSATIQAIGSSSAPTAGSYPDGKDQLNTTVLIIVILPFIAIIMFVLVVMVSGLVILKANRKKSSKKSSTSDQGMEKVSDRGICMYMHFIIIQYICLVWTR